MPYTKQLINNRNFFLTALEAEKSKIKAPVNVVPGEGLFWGTDGASLLCLYMVEEPGSSLGPLL